MFVHLASYSSKNLFKRPQAIRQYMDLLFREEDEPESKGLENCKPGSILRP